MIFNADGTFFEWGTQRDMLRQMSVYGILACGMTLVIISGGIDLSVGSVMALCAVTFSILGIHLQWSGFLAAGVTLAAGAACGALSGWVIARFKVQPFIATLAMMVFARGVAKLLSGGEKVSTAVQAADGTYQYVPVPASFQFLDARVLGGNVAVVTLLLAVCIAVSWWFLARTVWGRRFYAIGGNETAAWYSGVPINRMKVLAYTMSGAFCAIAGMCQAGQEVQGDPETGMGYELTAIAMVVIGGTALNGGKGTMGLTVLGILIIGSLEKILSINAVGEASRLVLTGVIIVGAVLFQGTKS